MFDFVGLGFNAEWGNLSLDSILSLSHSFETPKTFAMLIGRVLSVLMPAMVLAYLGALFADFVGSVLHWWQDTYADPSWPIIGPLVAAPNIEHHKNPRSFTKASFLKRNRVVFPLIGVFALVLIPIFGLNPFLLGGLLAGAFANEVHVWAHRTPKENGRFISLLQRSRLIQGFRHHLNHHSGEKDTHFAVITPWVNPVLERLDFWDRLTALVERVTGAKPRDETIAMMHAAA